MLIDQKYYSIELCPSVSRLFPFHFDMSWAYAYKYSLKNIVGRDEDIVGVLNVFSRDVFDSRIEDNTDLLFGEIICMRLPLKGQLSAKKIYHQKVNRLPEDLPVMCSRGKHICSYMDKGQYFLAASKKIDCARVKHLEEITQYGISTIRMRIYAEIIKTKIKEGVISLTKDKAKEICCQLYAGEPIAKEMDSLEIRGIVNMYFDSFWDIPLYKDIPQNMRGKLA